MDRPFSSRVSHFAVAIVGAAACTSLAQQPQKIDAGTSDVSPNAVSLRNLGIDLRQPTGFEGVYQLSKVDAFGRGQAMFMRIDGGITAIFTRSVYVPTEFGMVPQIPPGTIFHIGKLPTPEASRGHIAPTFLNTQISDRLPSPPDEPPVIRDQPALRSMISNEIYRRRRVEALVTPDA